MSSAQSSKSPGPGSAAPVKVAGTRAWQTLGARLGLWYVAVTLASFAIITLVFALHTRASVTREGQESAEVTLSRYRLALEAGGTDAVRALVVTDGGNRESVAVTITDQRELEVLSLSSDDGSKGMASALRAAKGRGRPIPEDWHVAAAHVSEGRTLSIVVHDESAPRVWQHAQEVLWGTLAVGLLTAVAGGFLISRRALRPVGDLARATQSVLESGDLGLRVPERASADELDSLSRLFNQMLARNQGLVRAMKESLDNVAHDLRTPLTRLRAGAELALHEPADPAAQNEALADVIEETDRVLGMLTALMDISEAEVGAMRLDRKREDLALIAREAVELYEHVANDRGVDVVTHFSPDVMVNVDHSRILQVCANLLDNAIKYTPAGGRVEISVARDGEWGVLDVADTGVGVPEEDRSRIFERLFRGDRSRTERGLGLGLSLVKAVVVAHGGEVGLRDDVARGAAFEVRLR